MICNCGISLSHSLASLSKSYIMGCPHARGDNPQAEASGLSYAYVDKHNISIFNNLQFAHQEIYPAKGGKGGINHDIYMSLDMTKGTFWQ